MIRNGNVFKYIHRSVTGMMIYYDNATAPIIIYKYITYGIKVKKEEISLKTNIERYYV